MSIDQYLFAVVNAPGNPLLNAAFVFITAAGPLVAAASALLFIPRNRRMFLLYVVALGLDLALVYVLKYTIMRPRPEGMLLLPLELSPSFPSTHASLAFVWLAFMGKFSRKIAAASAVFATSVAVSRVYLGDHYPSDVIFGAALGYAIAVLVMQYGQRLLSRRRRR